jgi:hypothetical protein
MSPSTMTQLYKVFFILAILLIAVDAKHKHKIKKFRPKIPKIPFFPHLPPFDLPRDYNDLPGDNNDNNDDNNNNNDNPIFKEIKPAEGDKKDDFEIASIGSWEIISENSGVSAMHVNLLPSNKIIVYDAKIYRMSRINLPDGVPCLPFKDANNEDRLDCFAHAVEYDIETNQVRPLKVCPIIIILILTRIIYFYHFHLHERMKFYKFANISSLDKWGRSLVFLWRTFTYRYTREHRWLCRRCKNY